MHKKLVCLVMVIFCLGMIKLSAQNVSRPEKGSPERTAIIATLRGPVETELKQKIVFVVHYLNVQGSWAFLGGDLQTPSGGRPNFKMRNIAATRKTA